LKGEAESFRLSLQAFDVSLLALLITPCEDSAMNPAKYLIWIYLVANFAGGAAAALAFRAITPSDH